MIFMGNSRSTYRNESDAGKEIEWKGKEERNNPNWTNNWCREGKGSGGRKRKRDREWTTKLRMAVELRERMRGNRTKNTRKSKLTDLSHELVNQLGKQRLNSKSPIDSFIHRSISAFVRPQYFMALQQRLHRFGSDCSEWMVAQILQCTMHFVRW